MPQSPHIERHFTGSAVVRDLVIGMSDGLTVPFALAAGLSGAVSSTAIIVTAGLAEIVAGSIAMGLGGYLAALFVFRWVKGRFAGARPARSAGQTVLVGRLAAAAAFGLAKPFG